MTKPSEYFKDLCGHEAVKRQLEAAVSSGKTGHAYIFTGPLGVGRYTAAHAFAKAIVGTDKETHPDIITVTNELYSVKSKSDSILVETIGEMRRDIFIKPYSAAHKVYIIPKADTMNAASQNKLLKVLEEPPSYCTMILIAENKSKLLPTVLSRTSEISFSPLPAGDVADYLMSRLGAAADKAAACAAISGGSIGQAKLILKNSSVISLRDEAIEKVIALKSSKNRVIFELAKFIKDNKNDIDYILTILRSIFDDAVHLKLGLTEKLANIDKRGELSEFAGRITSRSAVNLLDITAKYEKVFKSNANFRISAFCISCEYWEELHGRNYRSTI